MKKYIFFPTDEKHWLNVARKLYEDKVAEPVLWLGDDRHFIEAKKIFGNNVYQDLIHRHRNYNIQDTNYNGEYEDFFTSENYLRAKDRCIKMMDRIDLYGIFGRLDREIYFHNLLITYLKKIYNSKPDVLITSENPHDHAKYIIYEICDFLNIPAFKFHNLNLLPLIFLQNIKSGVNISKPSKISSRINNLLLEDIDTYIKKLKKEDKNYELHYMKYQRINSKLLPSIINFFKKDFIKILKDTKHNTEMLLSSTYNPINPFRLNLATRYFIKYKRKKNLSHASSHSSEQIEDNINYVYFPLHYEPEKTTNPDGGIFHDQFIALVKLRKFLPEDIHIIVKEHPSQLYSHFFGHRGRSPLFYKLIKNIKGLKLVDIKEDSLKLLKNSLFIATITGSMAIEASVLGKKSLIFGNAWHQGCPNSFKWSKKLTYDDINNADLEPTSETSKFLIKLMESYAIPGFINGVQRKYFIQYADSEFELHQNNSLYELLKKFFKEDLT